MTKAETKGRCASAVAPRWSSHPPEAHRPSQSTGLCWVGVRKMPWKDILRLARACFLLMTGSQEQDFPQSYSHPSSGPRTNIIFYGIPEEVQRGSKKPDAVVHICSLSTQSWRQECQVKDSLSNTSSLKSAWATREPALKHPQKKGGDDTNIIKLEWLFIWGLSRAHPV